MVRQEQVMREERTSTDPDEGRAVAVEDLDRFIVKKSLNSPYDEVSKSELMRTLGRSKAMLA